MAVLCIALVCVFAWACFCLLLCWACGRGSGTQGWTAVIEASVLDFRLSNTFEQYREHRNAHEQQAMFAQMGVKTFCIGVSKDDPKRAIVMLQGLENILYEIFAKPDTKPIVDASGHVYEGTVITRWLS